MSPLYILKTISYLSVWEYMKKMNNETSERTMAETDVQDLTGYRMQGYFCCEM